jgi:pimeloyl-ACP methyl ester carboxylesterase
MLRRLLIVLVALASIPGVSAAQSNTAAGPTGVRNIVLVHGAFADGSSYAKVIPLLLAKGYRVTAVQNPLSSLAEDVAAAKRAIALQDGPVILVGHSWGGMSVSEAGNDPKVVGLVYIAAIVPDEGQTANDVLKPYPPTPGLGHMAPDASGYLLLTRQGIEEDFVPDLPASERALVLATQGPWNSTALAEKVPHPAWKSKPSWFIAVNDRILPADYELVLAKHINAHTTKLASGHVPMLSHPKEVAAVIIDAANHAGAQAPANKAASR